MSKWILLSLAFTQQSFAGADVNMKDGSFIATRIDLRIGGAGPVSVVSRTYHSQSVRRGAFGFGWSSDLENFLKPRANGIQKLKVGPRTLHVEFDSRARVAGLKFVSLKWGARTSLKYVYSDDVLVKVQNNGKTIVSYSYDSVQNLTLQKEGGLHERIQYDRDNDRVTARRTTSGCREKYEYKLEGPLASETRLERSCPGQHTKQLRVRFAYERDSSGQIVLAKTQLISGTKQREILYDVNTGLAVRIGSNQNTQGEEQ